MEPYHFKHLLLNRQEVVINSGDSLPLVVQYVADEARWNCFGAEDAQYIGEKKTHPAHSFPQLESDQVRILATWVMMELDAALDEKSAFVRRGAIESRRVFDTAIRFVDPNKLLPRFRILYDYVLPKSIIDKGSKSRIVQVSDELARIPLCAVLGAYTLVRIDQGYEVHYRLQQESGPHRTYSSAINQSPYFPEDFYLEAAGAHSLGRAILASGYHMSDESLKRAAGPQKKIGKPISRTKPFYDRFIELIKNEDPGDANAAYNKYVRKLDSLAEELAKPVPSPNTIKKWYREYHA